MNKTCSYSFETPSDWRNKHTKEHLHDAQKRKCLELLLKGQYDMIM